jgi:hypothetical protein
MGVAGVWRYDFTQPFPPSYDVPGGDLVAAWFAARPSWSAPEGCGVVTACDDCYFPGVQFLAASLRGRCPLLVFDLGLSLAQVEWLFCRGVAVCSVGDEDLVCPRSVVMWQTWNKPAYVAASPFSRTLWIDADCVVVSDLGPLFAAVASGPLVFQHVDPHIYQAANAAALYNRFPLQGRRLPGGVQAAVVGFAENDGSGLLTAWGRACAQFWEPGLAQLVRCWDQGALLWALESLGLGEVARPSVGWNRFFFPGSKFGLGTVAAFFASLVVAGDDVILHLVGRPKYWVNWGKLVPF